MRRPRRILRARPTALQGASPVRVVSGYDLAPMHPDPSQTPRELGGARLRTLVVGEALEAAAALAEEIATLVEGARAEGQSATLGLATGETPRELYAQLVQRSREGLDLSEVTTFNLDEYVGLAPDHPASFAAFMRRNLFEPAGMSAELTHSPDGTLSEHDYPLHCAEYERAITATGGIDLQVLGLGRNGHIAFNEPGTAFDSRTRVARLTEDTRAANAGAFPDGEEVPRRAVTMGLATILEARRVRLLAFGASKAAAVERLLREPARRELPASCLHGHPDIVVWVDEAAVQRLR